VALSSWLSTRDDPCKDDTGLEKGAVETVQFDKAYYIKLGRGGEWEESALAENKLRIGRSHQSLEDLNNRRWAEIRAQLAQTTANEGAATRDLHALRMVCESTPSDVWITFHSA
jgi:hypothetical protein